MAGKDTIVCCSSFKQAGCQNSSFCLFRDVSSRQQRLSVWSRSSIPKLEVRSFWSISRTAWYPNPIPRQTVNYGFNTLWETEIARQNDNNDNETTRGRYRTTTEHLVYKTAPGPKPHLLPFHPRLASTGTIQDSSKNIITDKVFSQPVLSSS